MFISFRRVCIFVLVSSARHERRVMRCRPFNHVTRRRQRFLIQEQNESLIKGRCSGGPNHDNRNRPLNRAIGRQRGTSSEGDLSAIYESGERWTQTALKRKLSRAVLPRPPRALAVSLPAPRRAGTWAPGATSCPPRKQKSPVLNKITTDSRRELHLPQCIQV